MLSRSSFLYVSEWLKLTGLRLVDSKSHFNKSVTDDYIQLAILQANFPDLISILNSGVGPNMPSA